VHITQIRNALIELNPTWWGAHKPLHTWRKGLVNVEELEKAIEQKVTEELSRRSMMQKLASLLKEAANLLPQPR